jgi:hypothetical protein
VHPVFSFSVIPSKPESIQDWAVSLRERYPSNSIAVACELKNGPLINALLKYDHITIFPINPSTVAKYRKAWIPSGAKSDPSNTKHQIEIPRDHGNKLSAIEPDSAEVRARYLAVNQQRIEQIRTATALTEDPGVVEPSCLMIELLTPQLKALLEAIERMDQEIKRRYKAMPDNEFFSSFPAACPKMAPRLMVAFGLNRDHYAAAHELQKYSGVAPVIESSGNKTWTHWRYSCPTFLRQTFVEWAGLTVQYSFWARAYYEQQKSKGKPHNTIMRSLVFK